MDRHVGASRPRLADDSEPEPGETLQDGFVLILPMLGADGREPLIFNQPAVEIEEVTGCRINRRGNRRENLTALPRPTRVSRR